MTSRRRRKLRRLDGAGRGTRPEGGAPGITAGIAPDAGAETNLTDHMIISMLKKAHDLRVSRGAEPDFAGFLQEVKREANADEETEITDTIREVIGQSLESSKDGNGMWRATDARSGTVDGAPGDDWEMQEPWWKVYDWRAIAGKAAGAFDDRDPDMRHAARGKTAEIIAVKAYAPRIRNKHYLAAIRRKERGDTAGALRHLDRAVRELPDNTDILSDRNSALTDLGRLDEAMEGCRKVLEMDPDHVGAHSCMGIALRRSGKAAESIPYHDKAIEHAIQSGESGRDLARLYTNKGAALSDLGNMNEALEMHSEAIRIDTSYATAYRNKAGVLANMGFTADAEECISTALQIEFDAV